jgi:hypothetical protein
MGRDAMSVVDGNLKVGIENLRIADGVHHAPRDHWRHDGTLRRHRRACRRDATEGSRTMRTSRRVTPRNPV